jgi:hypothetical protein
VASLNVHSLYFLWSFIGCVSECAMDGISEFSTHMRVSTECYKAVRHVGYLRMCFLHEPKALVLVREE